MIKKVTYNIVGRGPTEFEYDSEAPCRICGYEVGSASTGGIDVCPACDCGYQIPCFYDEMGNEFRMNIWTKERIYPNKHKDSYERNIR